VETFREVGRMLLMLPFWAAIQCNVLKLRRMSFSVSGTTIIIIVETAFEVRIRR